MILHPDGRVEGTPEEIAAYMKLKQDKTRGTYPIPDVPIQTLPLAAKQITSAVTAQGIKEERYPGQSHGPFTTNVQSQAQYDAITASRAK
ncbi:hypothetical protein [Paenibacillus apii]|uniref:hypothetical protein n=1 Tax=Paenibacillus apii TaxID=1850370 RepID=UPI0014392928|nr:hypothetical protein [Paenibacillus apii]NJJ38553.1 hypothetical protein [Paenibacillus apii]